MWKIVDVEEQRNVRGMYSPVLVVNVVPESRSIHHR
jgi:hypothetical protein